MEDSPEGRHSQEAGVSFDVYETDDGELVLYDERNPDAYLRSSLTVDITR